jgi:MFS family permease
MYLITSTILPQQNHWFQSTGHLTMLRSVQHQEGPRVMSAQSEQQHPGWMRALVAVVVIDMLGTGLYLPVSLLYFTKVAGISLETTGLCLSAAQVLTLPLPLVVGRLVDRLGARTVVTVGLALQAAGFAGYLLVSSTGALFLTACLAALGQRAYWSSIFTLIADLTTSATRDHAYSVTSAAQNAGVGVGALLAAGLLAAGQASAYQVVIGLNAATFALSAVILCLRVPADRHTPRDETPVTTSVRSSVGGPLRDRPFVVLVAANTVFAVCSGMLGLGLPVFVDAVAGRAGWMVGVLLGLNTAALALCQTMVARRLAGRRRTRVLCVAAAAWAGWGILMAATLALPVRWIILSLFPVTVIYVVAELLHAPTSNALASECGPAAERGRYMSTFQFSFAFSGVIGPVLFTQLFAWHPAAPWLLAGVAALAAGVTVVSLESRLPAAPVRAMPAAKESQPV